MPPPYTVGHKLAFTPHWDTPTGTPPPWPPPGWRKDPKVGLGDSWGSIASRFTITDVWDLIFYNFRTQNPREVNWYMHHYLGCWKTKDGKNFCFDEAEVGQLYIPPVGWTRGTGALPIESFAAEVLDRCVADYRPIYWEKTWVGPTGLGKVIRAVRDGRIKVVLDPAWPTPASYDPDANKLFIKTASFAKVLHVSTLVHEATHAVLDQNKADLAYWKHEFLGFLAQGLFGWQTSPTWADKMARDATLANPYRYAFVLAQYLYKDPNREKYVDNHDTSVPDFRNPAETINPVTSLGLAIKTDIHYIQQKWWERRALDGLPAE